MRLPSTVMVPSVMAFLNGAFDSVNAVTSEVLFKLLPILEVPLKLEAVASCETVME